MNILIIKRWKIQKIKKRILYLSHLKLYFIKVKYNYKYVFLKIKSIIVMRHGERIDCVDSKSNQLLSEYDPELTEKGIKQAKDIAKQIQKSLKKEINTLNIYISPFTRTLMTGLNIVKKLNLDNNNIFIVNDLFEVCSENNFKYFPLSSLLINSKIDKKIYIKNLLKVICLS